MRRCAALIAIASIIGTITLIAILEPVEGAGDDFERTYGSVIWALLRYFTILTNAIVSFSLLGAAIRGYWKSFEFFTGATVWIVLVGVIYHGMLASIHNPEGLSAITNHIHHTFVPAATLLLWLLTRPRNHIDGRQPFKWLIFPLIYTAYTITRAELLSDVYPYPFSNPDLIGWPKFAVTQIVLVMVFLGVGFGFRAVNNWLHGRRL